MIESQFKNCNALTIDVEDWYHFSTDNYSAWDTFEGRLDKTLDQILQFLENYQVKATFFCLGHAAKRHPEAIKAIVKKTNHEIASHGWRHEYIYKMSPKELKEDLHTSRKYLQDLTGQPVTGFRACSFSINKKTLWALPIIQEAGFIYDSSIYPVRNFYYGFPEAPATPFFLDKKKSLCEFPPSLIKIGKFRISILGGFHLRWMPAFASYWAAKKLQHSNRPKVIYFHPWELDLEQPRLNMPIKWKFFRYFRLKHTQFALEYLLPKFNWQPMAKILSEIPDLPTVGWF